MVRTWSVAASILLMAASTVVAAPDDLPPVSYIDESGQLVQGKRCGAEAPTTEQLAAVRAALTPSPLERSGDCVGTARDIALAFHIITSGASGSVTDAQIANQVKALNAGFAGSGFTFHVVDIERINNTAWFNACNTSAELTMKAALAYDPTELINIYTCKPGSDILGVATLPYAYPEDDYRHGVILHFGTLPGGSAKPYNLGDTAVHEMGHYFGLLHTFQGGCTGQGDFVGDTPAEKSAASGCPTTRNTCPTAGFDPVANFMDYSNDSCLVNFTLGQLGLMHAALDRYRPSLP